MDTTVPGIVFDPDGVCTYCGIHDEMEKAYPAGEADDARFNALVSRIKQAGRGKRFDAVVGVSGGTDSTYTLYLAVKYGLRPLAVHFDNGWNSREAVLNIKNSCDRLGVELYTYVVDWEEFKDLQIAFLKASTPDAEVPTDIGIHSILIRTAAKYRIKYVLNGHSFRNEGMSPLGWTYMDGRYIKDVQRRFGSRPLRTFPNFTLADTFYYNILRGITVVPFLNYVRYNKSEAKEQLKREVGWLDYGGHHHESTYTKFWQSYALPQKFGIDKRKTELSSMIRSGQATREHALAETSGRYPYDEEIVGYVADKLGLSRPELDALMLAPVKSFRDYRTYYPLIQALKPAVKAAVRLKLLPSVLYYKFFKS